MTDDDILAAILRREGVYDNDPADAGGETAYGISKRYHPEAWKNGPPTREQAIAIYRQQYLAPFAGVVPDTLKAQVVDIAVNCGTVMARTMLSLALAQTARPVEQQLVIERLKYYARRVQARPANAKFLPGWVNRAVEFL